MRALTLLLTVAACASTPTPTPTPAPQIVVLGLEALDSTDKTAVTNARGVTQGLREDPRAAIGPYQLAPSSEQELVDAMLLHDCAGKVPACFAAIGAAYHAAFVIYGDLASTGAGYPVEVTLIDVARKQVVKQTAELLGGSANPVAFGKQLYVKLVGP